MKTSGAGLLCSFAWVMSGCGSAAAYNYDLPPAEDHQQTLARIPGTWVGDLTGADPGRLRFALVWFPISPGDGKVQYPQRADHQLRGLSNFEIDISQEPPRNAIDGTAAMRYAQAEVVLYEDRNDNKGLDIVSPGSAPLDRVWGRAPGLRVWWLDEGSPAPMDMRGEKPVQLGWSFTYGPIKAAPDVRECEPGREMGDTWKPVCPPSTVKEPAKDVTEQTDGFILTVSDEPQLQSYACRGFWGTSADKTFEWPDTTPGWNAPEVRSKICNAETCDRVGEAGVLDLPVKGRNVKIECNPDRTTYRWRDCAADPKLCGTIFCHEGRGARNPDLTKAPPSGWPAECQ